MKTISAATLRARLDQEPALRVIDVLPKEHFSTTHLPGAHNACVYEMTFLDQVRAIAPPDETVVVYGASAATREATMAVLKLEAAGYKNVLEFPGGLVEWEAAGFPLERNDASPLPAVSGRFHVDTDRSTIRWTGRNLFNHHEGTVQVAGGDLRFEDGVLREAWFSIDLNSLACRDLEDQNLNALLIRHLRSDDFFAVDTHKTAQFVVAEVVPVPDTTPGTPNYTLRGSLTLRGETHPFQFPAVIAPKSADEVVGQAQIAFDRTLWGAIYGSGKFFGFLGTHVVNDLVDLHLKLFAIRAVD